MKWIRVICLSTLLVPLAVAAQDEDTDEDDGGFLTRTIENALSGSGREVSLEGFQGALSAEASFDRLTISDDNGAWLTLENVRLLWSRAALLRGRLVVEELIAQNLDLPRLPETEPAPALPDAEAEPFSMPQLPELPVSIDIGRFAVENISLGEPIIGVPVRLQMSASARLNDEGLLLNLAAQRTDDTEGRFGVELDFQREDSQIVLDLSLDEAPGGLAARLLNLPGQPSVGLSVAGTGPLTDFTADINLETDDTERLAGQVELLAGTDAEGVVTGQRVLADLSGDVTSLVAPEYRDFFGPDVSLVLDATREASGAIDVADLQVDAESAQIAGRVRLNEEFWPDFIDLDGRVGREDGVAVVPPGADEGTQLQSADLTVDYDARSGDAFEGRATIADLLVPGVALSEATLTLEGTLSGAPGEEGEFLGDLVLSTAGISMEDDALAEAIGSDVSAQANIDFKEGGPLSISDLQFAGADYGLTGDFVVSELSEGFPTDLNLAVEAEDLSRFAALAGQDLAGSADLQVEGAVTPLSGMFDLTVSGGTTDLSAGIPEADNVMQGRTDLNFGVNRDTTGTFLRDLTLQNAALDLAANASLTSAGGEATAQGRLNDLALVVPDHPGPVTFDVSAEDPGTGWEVDASLDAPYDAALRVLGVVTGPEMDVTIDVDLPDVNPLVAELEGPVAVDGRVWQAEGGYNVDVTGSGPLQAQFAAEGIATGPETDLDIDLSVGDISPLVPELEGGIDVAGRLWQANGGYNVDVAGSGPLDAEFAVEGLATGPDALVDIAVSVPDLQPIVPDLEGGVSLDGQVQQADTGYDVDLRGTGPFDATFAVAGLATGPDTSLDLSVRVPDVQPVVPTLEGALEVDGNVALNEGGDYEVDLAARGPLQAALNASGVATGPSAEIGFDLDIPDVSPLAPQVTGPLQVAGTVSQAETGYAVDVKGGGPLGADFNAEGLATGPETDLTFALAVPSLAPLAPPLTGPVAMDGRVWLIDTDYNIDVTGSGPLAADFSAKGQATGPDAALEILAQLPDLAPLVSGVSGPVTVDAQVDRADAGWQIDSDLTGPAGTEAKVAGLVADDSTLDLAITGGAPLTLAAPFIEPRSATGQAQFDLAVQGEPGLDALSGRFSISDGRVTDPTQNIALTDLTTTVDINGNTAQINAGTNVDGGGRIEAGGSVSLANDLAADLDVGLRGVVLTDPLLYTTRLDGDIAINGPLAGGATIAGVINVGETNISVPTSGFSTVGAIPDITHVGGSEKSRITRIRAGVELEEEPEDAASGDGSGGFGLDIDVNAPNRIFVRGRGLDAELGGDLEITGTTERIISAGQFELIRGRLDLLGKRFDLVEGSAQFIGSLTPDIRFVTTAPTNEGTASITVEGPADEPEVTFASTPEAPEDEVIAQLLFNRSISELTAIQALQLANAVAVLAGRSGVGVVGGLRGGLGLDDFDLTTTDDGATAVRAGKYLTERIYTDFIAAGSGESELSINFEVTDSLDVRATVEENSDTGIGFFFERDY